MKLQSDIFSRISEIPVKVFFFAFENLAKYTSYIFAVSIFTAGTAGAISSAFALYYFDAVNVSISSQFLWVLKISILLYWVLIMVQNGLFHRIGFSGMGETIKTVNKLVSTNPRIFIPDNLKSQEYKSLSNSIKLYI